jgi:hypothetical protein
VPRLDRIAALTGPQALGALFGPVQDVHVEPLPATNGSTRATHRRVRVRLGGGRTHALWLKENRPDTDWTARGTGDTVGREAALLAEPGLAGVWDSIACPYRAYAVEDGAYALLMDDVSEHLVPHRLGYDVRSRAGAPEWLAGRAFTVDEEDAVLTAVAGMHARYWGSPVTRLPWLQSPWHRMRFIGPRDRTPSEQLAAMRARWDLAQARLPAPVAELLLAPTDELAGRCAGLPWTVFHGDLRTANLALPPDGRLVALDWGLVGAGPATLDLFWYLFLHPHRRARSHEGSLARYRQLLEAALGARVAEAVWTRLVDVGLLCGAIMTTHLLAESVAAGMPGAAAEWDWRVQRLERLT